MSKQQRRASNVPEDPSDRERQSSQARVRGSRSPQPEQPTSARPWQRSFSLINLLLFVMLCMLVGVIFYILRDVLGTILPMPEQIVAEPTAILANDENDLLDAPTPALRSATLEAIIPTVGPPLDTSFEVGSAFRTFYDTRGGLDVFGLPVGEPLEVNGREIQWFERARMEFWPEFAGTPYEVQLGLLGVEYTQERNFPNQTFFPSRPGLRYFPETEHGVGEPFLSYWEQNGGLDTFGYPISEAFDELLDDGTVYRVQYFERARLEQHPALAGTPYEVQVGLLGRALAINERRPDSVPPAPTDMPLP